MMRGWKSLRYCAIVLGGSRAGSTEMKIGWAIGPYSLSSHRTIGKKDASEAIWTM